MIKQVIVIRKDLKMRRGKEIAQGAHASMKWLVDRIMQVKGPPCRESPGTIQMAAFTDDELEWMTGKFTKVCLQVDSGNDLVEVYKAAKEARLTVALIEDSGKTEFGGIPTLTCIAIGPNDAEAIDKVTGKLNLY